MSDSKPFAFMLPVMCRPRGPRPGLKSEAQDPAFAMSQAVGDEFTDAACVAPVRKERGNYRVINMSLSAYGISALAFLRGRIPKFSLAAWLGVLARDILSDPNYFYQLAVKHDAAGMPKKPISAIMSAVDRDQIDAADRALKTAGNDKITRSRLVDAALCVAARAQGWGSMPGQKE